MYGKPTTRPGGGTEQVHELARASGRRSHSPCFSSLICPVRAVCHQVTRDGRGEESLHPDSGGRPHCPKGLSAVPVFWQGPGKRMGLGTSIQTLWNNQLRWKTRRIPKEYLVPTPRH
jgi:hypothetical protein